MEKRHQDESLLIKVLLPNKEQTTLAVGEDDVLLEVFKSICEKRQFDTRDYVLSYENPKKKKTEDLDLTKQVRQYEGLKEVTLSRIRKKSFLQPASSKGTNLRSVPALNDHGEAGEGSGGMGAAPSPTASAEEPVPTHSSSHSSATLSVASSLSSEGGDSEPKRKGRLRSISATFRPNLAQLNLRKNSPSSSGRPNNFEMLREDGNAATPSVKPHHHQPEEPPKLLLANLMLTDTLLNDPALAAFMSNTVIPTSPVLEVTIQVPQATSPSTNSLSASSSTSSFSSPILQEALSTVHSDDSSEMIGHQVSSADDISREKILLKGDSTKTMTLQRKKLRPRSSTVTEKSESKEEEEVVLRCMLPGGNQTAIKITPSSLMEVVLKTICEKKGFAFEDYTLRLPESDKDVDLDRPLSFFNLEMPLVILVPSKEKSYSTMCVSEGDRDVMILTYVDGKLEVTAATEDKLIEKLTDEQETDNKFMDVLLLTYRSFMTPEDFFESLIGRFNSEPPEGASEDELKYYSKWIDPVRNKVLIVLSEWIKTHWHDFGFDQGLQQNLNEFISQASRMAHTTNDIENSCERLRNLITSQSKRHAGILESIQTLGAAVLHEGDSPLLSLKPRQVAEQLCVLNHELFSNIDGIEFLNQIWRSGSGDDLQCPHLLRFIDRFNKESAWVATEICLTVDFKKRVDLVKRFIEITKESFDRNNFFSVFSFLAGLNLTPVQKLKKTWASIPASARKTHEELEKLANPSKNMKAYRDHQAQCKPPILPFIPIHLKDLIFYNDGNPSRLNNLVNFEKLRMMANKIHETLALAVIPFPFEKDDDILAHLRSPYTERLELLSQRISVEGFDS